MNEIPYDIIVIISLNSFFFLNKKDFYGCAYVNIY